MTHADNGMDYTVYFPLRISVGASGLFIERIPSTTGWAVEGAGFAPPLSELDESAWREHAWSIFNATFVLNEAKRLEPGMESAPANDAPALTAAKAVP